MFEGGRRRGKSSRSMLKISIDKRSFVELNIFPERNKHGTEETAEEIPISLEIDLRLLRKGETFQLPFQLAIQSEISFVLILMITLV